MTSRAITIGTHLSESRDCLWLAPPRHYRNSHSRFSFFTALLSWMTIEFAARSLQFYRKCTDDGRGRYRNVCENVVYKYCFGRCFHYFPPFFINFKRLKTLFVFSPNSSNYCSVFRLIALSTTFFACVYLLLYRVLFSSVPFRFLEERGSSNISE